MFLEGALISRITEQSCSIYGQFSSTNRESSSSCMESRTCEEGFSCSLKRNAIRIKGQREKRDEEKEEEEERLYPAGCSAVCGAADRCDG